MGSKEYVRGLDLVKVVALQNAAKSREIKKIYVKSLRWERTVLCVPLMYKPLTKVHLLLCLHAESRNKRLL